MASTKSDAYIEARRNQLDIESYTEQNIEQRDRAVLEATGGLLKGAVDVATTAPGTSLTGRPGLPKSWSAFLVKQGTSRLFKAMLPVKATYNAYLDYLLGLNRGGTTGRSYAVDYGLGDTSLGAGGVLDSGYGSYGGVWGGPPSGGK